MLKNSRSAILSATEITRIKRRRSAAKARARRIARTILAKEAAQLTRAAQADPDNPPLRAGAVLRPAHEVHPNLVAEQLRRGRPKSDAPKRQVTLRLDRDVVERLRASGPGWQTRVNAALRSWLQRQRTA
jgi:uncharacterized protein (DUF4415 family)